MSETEQPVRGEGELSFFEVSKIRPKAKNARCEWMAAELTPRQKVLASLHNAPSVSFLLLFRGVFGRIYTLTNISEDISYGMK